MAVFAKCNRIPCCNVSYGLSNLMYSVVDGISVAVLNHTEHQLM